MNDEAVTIPQLSPDQSEQVCAALRSWAPVLHDFYRSCLDIGTPPDLASGVVQGFWEATLAAGYDAGRYDGLD